MRLDGPLADWPLEGVDKVILFLSASSASSAGSLQGDETMARRDDVRLG
jgi:hypothetical protein